MLDVTNPPTRPVLAIHAGSVRRQAKLEVNQPFVIPHPGSQNGPVEVSLFQQLASHVLPSDNAPEVFCAIPVKKLDGSSSLVKLCVRRGDAAKPQKHDDSMGVTRDYLDQHQLQQRIQSLIQALLREQPDNPYKYMTEVLRKAQSGGRSDNQEVAPAAAQPSQDAAPMVPKPPQEPKRGSDGRGAGHVRKLKSVDYASNDNNTIEFAIQYPVHAPQGEFQVAARFSVTNLLRMPRCQKAAEQSLRNSARCVSASSISGLVINSVKEKIVSEHTCKTNARSLARASLQLCKQQASILLSPEYHRAVCTWARLVAYKGAGNMLGSNDARRASLPMPIVFLAGETSSWGSWLAK